LLQVTSSTHFFAIFLISFNHTVRDLLERSIDSLRSSIICFPYYPDHVVTIHPLQAEKNPISNYATVGIYYWKKGKDFVHYGEQMIKKNIRTNNEFYVCPIYNEAIQDGKKFKAYKVDEMWGMGTPEELNNFLANYK